MNILVLGGTRLLGSSVVRHLLSMGNSVTVVSRHPEKCPGGAECIGTELKEGLRRLSGRRFDAAVDFIAYGGAAPLEVFDRVTPGTYVLISSAWLVRLAASVAADGAIPSVDPECAKLLPGVTYSYLTGKMMAEAAVFDLRRRGGTATVLRLPIFWGRNEHTGRLEFYWRRVTDGGPIICVDGGNNLAQLAWTEDIARAMARWLPMAGERPIWEGLPDGGTRVRDIIQFIADCLARKPLLVDVPSAVLLERFPTYLMEEPLWRENPAGITQNNLFIASGMTPTAVSEWLCTLVKDGISEGTPQLRKEELAFLNNIK